MFKQSTLLFTTSLPVSFNHSSFTASSSTCDLQHSTASVQLRTIAPSIPLKRVRHRPSTSEQQSTTTNSNNSTSSTITMLGPFFPSFGDSNLLKSEIVRKEMVNLEKDYMEIGKLGSQYQKFDREGKIMYIDRALDVVDRFNIFLTRMKLSEDFSSQMFIKQYQMKLGEYGLTIESLFENTRKSLEMMKEEIPST